MFLSTRVATITSTAPNAPRDYPAPPWRRRLRLLAAIVLRTFLFLLLIMLTLAGFLWITRPRPRPPAEIYPGVTYECRRLPETAETGGLAHLIRVDLRTPGLDLYVTPADPATPPDGYEYTTRWTPRVALEEKTAVLVNGVLFDARRGSRGPPGDRARAIETLIADHQVNHGRGIYMMWFEDDLTPHIEEDWKAIDMVIRKAKWAVGSQIVWYTEHNTPPISHWAGHGRDRRTAFGVDTENKLLFIGVFDSISGAEASRILAAMGARQVVPVDGGTSTALVFGAGARGVPQGAMVYPLRALPTHFGIRVK